MPVVVHPVSGKTQTFQQADAANRKVTGSPCPGGIRRSAALMPSSYSTHETSP